MTKDLAGCIHGLAKYGWLSGQSRGWPQEQHSDHKDLQGSHKRTVTRSWLCSVATGGLSGQSPGTRGGC